jgi:hypothetical protein
MEYRLLKTIEPNLGINVPNEMMPRLTPYPATDFVNPGLGQIARLFSFYVPLHVKSLHSQNKNEPNVEAQLQEGSGNIDHEDANKSENEIDSGSENLSEQNIDADPIEYNEMKRKKMGFAVHDSFLHPKFIKTDKILLASPTSSKTPVKKMKTTKTESNATKTIKHKFQFV